MSIALIKPHCTMTTDWRCNNPHTNSKKRKKTDLSDMHLIHFSVTQAEDLKSFWETEIPKMRFVINCMTTELSS